MSDFINRSQARQHLHHAADFTPRDVVRESYRRAADLLCGVPAADVIGRASVQELIERRMEEVNWPGASAPIWLALNRLLEEVKKL